MDEYVVLVDENNNVLGTGPKLATHNDNTPLHRGFSVFLFSKAGDLLLQQRSNLKKTWPLIWSNSCCGHPTLEESPEQAGQRRLAFELGLQKIELHMILPKYRYKYTHKGVIENEICPVMIGFSNDIPQPNPKEVAKIRYTAWQSFLTEIKKDNDYSEWCVEEAQFLDASPLFQEIFSQKTRMDY